MDQRTHQKQRARADGRGKGGKGLGKGGAKRHYIYNMMTTQITTKLSSELNREITRDIVDECVKNTAQIIFDDGSFQNQMKIIQVLYEIYIPLDD
jgi:hypothetical protein